MIRLKQLLKDNSGGVWGEDPTGHDDSVVLRSTEQTADGRWRISDPATRSLTEAERRRYCLVEGDVLVTKSSGSESHIGKTTLVDYDVAALSAAYSNFMQRLRPGPKLDSSFLWYVLQSDWTRSQFTLVSTTTTGLGNLTGSQLGELEVPEVDVAEQRAIADFLDRETAQIDAFIAKNEHLIALLTERRAAIVARTVAGGSLQNGSGSTPADWFEQLPKGWRLVALKAVADRITDGAHISPETVGGEFDFVSTRDLTSGSIDFAGALKTSPETYAYMVKTGCQPRRGDVLFSKDGTIGETAIVREDHDFVVASSLIIITPDRTTVTSEYLRTALSSTPLIEQAKNLARGAGLPRISIANLSRILVPVPPMQEQVQIAEVVARSNESVTSAIETATQGINLARERRAALISAAVTGKIDVGVDA